MSDGCGCGLKEKDGDGIRTGKKFFFSMTVLCVYRTLLAAQKDNFVTFLPST